MIPTSKSLCLIAPSFRKVARGTFDSRGFSFASVVFIRKSHNGRARLRLYEGDGPRGVFRRVPGFDCAMVMNQQKRFTVCKLNLDLRGRARYVKFILWSRVRRVSSGTVELFRSAPPGNDGRLIDVTHEEG